MVPKLSSSRNNAKPNNPQGAEGVDDDGNGSAIARHVAAPVHQEQGGGGEQRSKRVKISCSNHLGPKWLIGS